MKKLALVTCYYQNNIGSMLQAYATQKICENLGFTCEHINIAKIQKVIKLKKIWFYLQKFYNIQILEGVFLKNAIRMFTKIICKKTIGQGLKKRKIKFKEFRNRYFCLSLPCKTVKKLAETCRDYDAIVVGSDQLWLPSNINADYFTLTWVPDRIKKISYATSFGISYLPSREQKKAKMFLSRIHFISVREESGQKIVEDCIGKKVPMVCDPTLLFDEREWDEIRIKERIIKEPYIFCYILGDSSEIRSFAVKMKRITGYKIVSLPNLENIEKNIFADTTPYEVGPCEFLNLIHDAEYIITDSFHGSVFSIIYKKKFFPFKRMKKEGILNTNGRLESLFERLELKDYLLNGTEDVNKCLNVQLNYNYIERKLESYRRYSKNYLSMALDSRYV